MWLASPRKRQHDEAWGSRVSVKRRSDARELRVNQAGSWAEGLPDRGQERDLRSGRCIWSINGVNILGGARMNFMIPMRRQTEAKSRKIKEERQRRLYDHSGLILDRFSRERSRGSLRREASYGVDEVVL